MMRFKVRLLSMADGAVITNGPLIFLVLQGLDAVPIRTELIEVGRINRMGTAVAGCAHHCTHIVVAVAIEIIHVACPDIEGIVSMTRLKILVAGEAVRLLNPWRPGIDFINRSNRS